jgi:hypothetical protein
MSRFKMIGSTERNQKVAAQADSKKPYRAKMWMITLIRMPIHRKLGKMMIFQE